ncbi:MAG TPA: hypothetical protein VGU20_21160 [Stellaceae bacterium]|nr:hypothetical protein [Stellaceae bacterium]
MDRATVLGHLQRAKEHVAQGERHIRRQQEIIQQLQDHGHDTELARELLATFEQLQVSHLADRDRFAKMLEKLG